MDYKQKFELLKKQADKAKSQRYKDPDPPRSPSTASSGFTGSLDQWDRARGDRPPAGPAPAPAPAPVLRHLRIATEVRDETGRPIPGAKVTIQASGDPREGRTDSLGFAFTELDVDEAWENVQVVLELAGAGTSGEKPPSQDEVAEKAH